jgi:hypothetical protein
MKLSKPLCVLILIALALFLSGARHVSAASNNPRPKKHQEAADKKAQTAKPLQPEPSVPLRDFEAAQSALLDALRALHAEQEARDREKRADREAFYANLISLGLLIVGIVYSRYAWKQWAAIKEQAKIANDALVENRKAADAAKDAAKAAMRNADVAEKQLHCTERPWIAFEPTKILGTKSIVDRIKRLHPSLQEPPDSPTVEIIQISVQYRFNNCGRTPARLVWGDVQLICADPKSLPSEPFYRFIPTPESLLPPGRSAINSLTVPLFPPAFEKFVRGRESLILIGFVQYRDVIGEADGPPHESRFRMECDFPGYDISGGKEVSFAGPFYFASAGNERYNRYT